MYTKKLYNGTTANYDRALSHLPTAQAGVCFTECGNVKLVSYSTTVLLLTGDGWMACSGLYSTTTRKHISAFLKEYAPHVSFATVSDMVKGGYDFNIHTGEIRNH